MIRVLVADDHSIVRKGMRFVLERQSGIEIVAEAEDGLKAVALAAEHQPDVVVLDIAMPKLNGLDAAVRIARRQPAPRIIMLSMHSDEEYLVRALNAGVRAYLLKDSAEEELPRAIVAVMRGQNFFSPVIAAAIASDYVQQLRSRPEPDTYDLLTAREKEVLQLLAEGRSNKEVAAVLDVSPYTVETHRDNLMRKLRLHGAAEIVLYAVRKKIIM